MARGALDDIRRIASRGAFDFRFGGSRGRAARFALYFASPRNTSRFTVEPGLWRAVPKFHTSENTGAGTPRAGSRGAGARWISRAHLLRPFADSPTVGLRVLFPSGNLVFSSFPPHRARPTAQLRPRYVSVSKQHVWLPPRAFEGPLPSFRERGASRFPSTHFAPPYAVFSNVRPSASIPFDPAALPEAVVVDGRAAACVCGLRGGGGRDSIVAGARDVGPGTYDAPGLSRRRHGDGSKAVMSLCCGSISSSFRAPAGVRPTVLRASTAPGKPHPRRAASGRTRRPPAAPAARRLQELIRRRKRRTSHPLLRLTRRSRRRRAENLLPHP